MVFLETGEKLNTINKILALDFGFLSATITFGLCFLLLSLVFLLCKNQALAEFKKINTRSAVVVLIIICWLPMFIEDTFANWQEIFTPVKLVSASIEDKLQTRLCAIDKNQEFANSVCSLEPFVKETKNLVPAQSKITIVSANLFSFFLQYYFIGVYQATNPESAEYWLIYLPKSGYQYTSNNELIEISGEDRKNWGQFQILKIFGQNMVILKKQ